MDILILDIGCSNVKGYVFRKNSTLQAWSHQVSTPTSAQDILCAVNRLYEYVAAEGYEINRHIVLSYSDSVVYEKSTGEAVHIPVKNDIPYQQGVPIYERSGKPLNSQLKGIAHQLLWLARMGELDGIRRILPISTYVATVLCGNKDWNHWDITHASNSGMFNFEKGTWFPEMQPFINAGVINEKIVPCKRSIPNALGMDILVGGHDTMFVNANDSIYATKPYLSCGTYVTASVESCFDNLKPDRKSRFLIAANGAVLEQICFEAEPYRASADALAETIIAFFQSRIGWACSVPSVRLFGSWAPVLESALAKCSSRFTFENMETQSNANQNLKDLKTPVSRADISYLHQQAAIFAGGA